MVPVIGLFKGECRKGVRKGCFLAEGRVYCKFRDFTSVIPIQCRDEFDPQAPQREAALFYGLFLRGHPADTLRKDIDIPKRLLAKWLKARGYEGNFRDNLRRVYLYRKQVLAIFDELVGSQRTRARLN